MAGREASSPASHQVRFFGKQKRQVGVLTIRVKVADQPFAQRRNMDCQGPLQGARQPHIARNSR